MPSVQRQRSQGDEVDGVGPGGIVEAEVHVLVGVTVHIVTTGGGVQRGELQDVPHNEQNQDHATPTHGAVCVA